MVQRALPKSVRARLARLPDGELNNLAFRLYANTPIEVRDETKLAEYRTLEDVGDSAARDGVVSNLACRLEALIRAEASPLGPWRFRSTSNLTCGMSTPTPLENGLTLLRPYGIPLLPASSVKGILCSWLAELLVGDLNLSENEQAEALKAHALLPLCGTHEKPGQLRFFDVLPSHFQLETDVTTVHYRDWYEKRTPPGGWHSPVPVYFLTVKAGSEWIFGGGLDCSRSFDWTRVEKCLEAKREQLELFGIRNLDSLKGFFEDLLDSTAIHHGFGSQTAQGYGRMKRISE